MSERIDRVLEEARPAVLTMPTGRVVPAVVADTAAAATRRQVQLLAEATPVRVVVALASCSNQ